MPLLNIVPDLEEAEEFLEYVTGGEEVAFRTFDDQDKGRFGARKLAGHISELAKSLQYENTRGAGVFWVVNKTDGKGQLDANVVGIRALFVDLDGSPLEPVLAETDALPHIVVETSPNKYHCYWLIENGMSLDDFKAYQIALANKFNGDASVHNPSRVLRVPGFYHVKDHNKPFKTRVIKYNQNTLYSPKDLAEILKLDMSNAKTKENVIELFPDKCSGVIPNGARDVTLFRMGAHLRHAGLEYDEICKILIHRNLTMCQEPLLEHQVKKIASSISKKKSAVLQHINGQPIVEKTSIKDKYNIITFEEVEKMEVEPIKWVIPDFLPQGLTILAGNPKLGKSWLAQEISFSVATGGLALGKFPTTQGSVLHLALEDPVGRFKERMKSIQRGVPCPNTGFFTNQWEIMSRGGLEGLQQWISEVENPSLIIIDTLQRFRGEDTNTGNVYANDYKDMATIQRLTIENNIGIVVVHHLNKNLHTDPMSRISGSQGISGAADLVWLFDRKNRDAMDASLRSMSRDLPDAKYNLMCGTSGAGWLCSNYEVDEDRSSTASRILDTLKEHETCSYTCSEIADKIGRTRSTVYKDLLDLVKDELIIRREDNKTFYYGLNRAVLGRGNEIDAKDFFCSTD